MSRRHVAESGQRSSRECPFAFTKPDRAPNIWACSLGGVSLWIRVRCPRSFSSHLEQLSLFFPPSRFSSSSLPAQACACAHAYIARANLGLFFISPLAENWPNFGRESSRDGIKFVARSLLRKHPLASGIPGSRIVEELRICRYFYW